jgi:Exostosin family
MIGVEDLGRPVSGGERRPRLKVYSNRSWLPPGHEGAHVTALCPFWGRNQNVGAAGWPDYADKLIEVGPRFLELTELSDADVAFFPARSRPLVREPVGLEYAHAFVDLARTAGKPAVFFYDNADTGFTSFPIHDVIVVRGSLLRSRQTDREFGLPGFHDDLITYAGGRLPLRRKGGKPMVSFCGAVIREHPPKNLLWKTRRIAGSARRYKWRMQGRHEEDLFIRAEAVDALLEQDDVETSIVLRESGGGGAWSGFDAELFASIRHEYVQNMIESDYVLCTRGDGNWSVRFYEALCLGRIPIFVDTDCVLPYDFLLPWRDYCVWIDRSQVKDIGALVGAFHESMSDRDFVDLQHECRRVWDEYVSPHGFFANFHRHFEQ